MVSVASDGAAERIARRILFRLPRAGCGTPARYSSTFFGTPPFAAELRLADFSFFMRTMLQELPLEDHPPGHQAPQKGQNLPPWQIRPRAVRLGPDSKTGQRR